MMGTSFVCSVSFVMLGEGRMKLFLAETQKDAPIIDMYLYLS